MNHKEIKDYDQEIFTAIEQENKRQEEHLELIASENYTSRAIMEAQGSILTNKYAEGYPNNRYYGGCKNVDTVENIAIDRAKKLFDCCYANVQPHSGSQANAAVFLALLENDDCILGMGLADGGHLTHGSKVSFSGKTYKAVSYGVDPVTHQIDYDVVEELALKHKPKLLIAGFSSYSGVLDWGRFRAIADKINAYFLVDMAHVSGLVAAKEYPSPLPHAHVVTSTTHKTLAGPRGGIILSNHPDPAFHKKLNSGVFPGQQGGPLMHVIAAKAIAFKAAMTPDFKAYQQQVIKNAQTMATVLTNRGYQITGATTHNHIVLVDLTNKNITGKDANDALENSKITVNKNSVPNDTRSPFVTSGIRLGTPAITTRGMKEEETTIISNWICDILDDINNQELQQTIGEQVTALCNKFPVYK